jgi:hypothetical protein
MVPEFKPSPRPRLSYPLPDIFEVIRREVNSDEDDWRDATSPIIDRLCRLVRNLLMKPAFFFFHETNIGSRMEDGFHSSHPVSESRDDYINVIVALQIFPFMSVHDAIRSVNAADIDVELLRKTRRKWMEFSHQIYFLADALEIGDKFPKEACRLGKAALRYTTSSDCAIIHISAYSYAYWFSLVDPDAQQSLVGPLVLFCGKKGIEELTGRDVDPEQWKIQNYDDELPSKAGQGIWTAEELALRYEATLRGSGCADYLIGGLQSVTIERREQCNEYQSYCNVDSFLVRPVYPFSEGR